ncbi:MAG: SpoIID/LytB domain-containing protein [Alicyclobacillus herbarius]|uniref:SpoIID/LytB domain-containing protein n=1 Tax=Alicyclobacillus herbarius TaxID=122960 RepID=UPI0023558DDF|nr:SpoIID/LytB domain-containing protein [Alicyclobacillus herbarius]MCL6631815.1 SpoIID/LytB domain-containing protein [Alicyclobacillus herbarius]
MLFFTLSSRRRRFRPVQSVSRRPRTSSSKRPKASGFSLSPRFQAWRSARSRAARLWDVDPRIQAGLLVAVVFFAMVVLPGVVAATVHQARGAADPLASWSTSRDAQATVRVYETKVKTVVEVPRNEYLLGVLAAEINPNAPMAALQAAAIAARTYVVHAQQVKTKGRTDAAVHAADVTDNSAVDLPWLPETDWPQTFGDDAGVVKARLEQAVLSTDGIILTYQDKPILAFITGTTNGSTRSAGGSLKTAAPYLRAVACPADKENPVTSSKTIDRQQLAKALGVGVDRIDVAGVRVLERDGQGYVVSVEAAGKSWTGESFAAALGLESPCFSIHKDASGLTIDVRGRGSGFGLSLHQASAWAKQGRSWGWILERFYPGTHTSHV